MGIDAEAYMAGVIPSFSRGGSWRPDEQSVGSKHPGGSAFGPGGQAASGASVMGIRTGQGMNMFNGFWQSPMYSGHQPNNPRTSRTVPPSPLASATPYDMNIMYRSVSGQLPTAPSRFAPRSPITSRHSMPLPDAPPSDKPCGNQRWEGRSWDDGAGAPKPMTREPDYDMASRREFANLAVQTNRQEAETLPAPPALGEALVQHARSETCDPKILQNRLPPNPASTRHSRAQSHRGNATAKRPTHSRRHTSDTMSVPSEPQMSPDSIPHHVRRDIAFDHDSRSPTTHKPPTAATTETGLSHDRSRSLTKNGLGETSPYVTLTTTRRARRSLQSTAPTRTSTTVTDKSLSAPTSQSSRAGDRTRLTPAPPPSPLFPSSDTRSPTPSQSGVPPSLVAEHPPHDMSSLSSALPMPSTPNQATFASPSIPRQAPASLRTPLNLGHRTKVDEVGYDQYSMHPAAATPPRADRDAVGDTMVPAPVTGLAPAAPAGKYPNGVYYPPGYAKPTKKVEWNRDGPAMKTHGVAWKKGADDLVLPDRPMGPRWLQARPPRTNVVVGGGWGQSGGNH